MTEPLNGLRFDIYERVNLPDDAAAIGQLEEIELVPHMQTEAQDDQVMLRGHLLLSGVYRPQDEEGGNVSRLEHWIPVEISLPLNRVERVEDLAVEIDNFDIDLLSVRSLNVTGVLALRGVQADTPPGAVWREDSFTVVHQAAPETGIPETAAPEAADLPEAESREQRVQSEQSELSEPRAQPEQSEQPREEWEPREADQAEEGATPSGFVWPGVAEGVNMPVFPGTAPYLAYPQGRETGLLWPFPSPKPEQPVVPRSTVPHAMPDPADTGQLEQGDERDANRLNEYPLPAERLGDLNERPLVDGWGDLSEVKAADDPASQPEPYVRQEPEMPVDAGIPWQADVQWQPEFQRQPPSQLEPAWPPDPELYREPPTPPNPEPQLAPVLPSESEDQQEPEVQREPEWLPEPSAPLYAPIEDDKPELKVAFTAKPPEVPAQPASGVGLLSQLGDKGAAREAEQLALRSAQALADETEAKTSRISTGDELEWTKLFLGTETEAESFRKVRMCIVQREETLDTIAVRYNVQPREIQLRNRLSDPYLSEGQVLYIP